MGERDFEREEGHGKMKNLYLRLYMGLVGLRIRG